MNTPLFSILSAGVKTLGEWQASVHSIFDKAVNLIVNDKRITLLSNLQWISEYNIVVNDSALFLLITPSSSLSTREGYLYIDNYPIAAFPPSTIWRMPQLLPLPLAAEGMSQVKARLAQSEKDRVTTLIEQQFCDAIGGFLSQENVDFSRVIGAGYGLTPTGDDMLVGFALAVQTYRPELSVKLMRECFPYLDNTSDISRYLLQDALSGQFSAPLVNLLLALQQNNRVEEALDVAINIGSTSGRDGIYGLFQGLKECLKL